RIKLSIESFLTSFHASVSFSFQGTFVLLFISDSYNIAFVITSVNNLFIFFSLPTTLLPTTAFLKYQIHAQKSIKKAAFHHVESRSFITTLLRIRNRG
ncbi:hypothetical protein, partial [Thermolongibacillus altinsuensis]|uniref:hypothetical protein n=1 Tax=Thermolongibacillus altinsuensis TaxID=575256 RepID=UPI0025539D08